MIILKLQNIPRAVSIFGNIHRIRFFFLIIHKHEPKTQTWLKFYLPNENYVGYISIDFSILEWGT